MPKSELKASIERTNCGDLPFSSGCSLKSVEKSLFFDILFNSQKLRCQYGLRNKSNFRNIAFFWESSFLSVDSEVDSSLNLTWCLDFPCVSSHPCL